jgi:hypothetical protein
VAKARSDDRQKKAAQRAQIERKRRRGNVTKLAVGVVVAAIVVAMAYSYYNKRQLLQAVKTTSYPAGIHSAGRIAYTEDPPMGGRHNVAWQNCGIYNAPIHNEHAVHSMEHGAVWITYRPDLPADQIEILKAAAADDFMLLSPYPGLSHPVVASAWNHQLTFERADDPALRAFISQYKNNPTTTPEFGAACSGGTAALATADSLGR